MVSYDAYKNRIEKIAAVKNFIVRFRALFIILTLLLLGGITTLLAIKGMVTGNLTVPAEVVYGDSYEVEGGSALMSSVKYEFSSASGGDWSGEKPTKAGKYLARIATQKSFGTTGHGASVAFEIKPRPTEFIIQSQSVVYGSDPAKYAIELVNGDRLAGGLSFEYENIDGFEASVCVNRASLQILSNGREDVTNCYEISAPSAQITLSAKKMSTPVKELNFTYTGETVLYESEIQKILQALLVDDDTSTFDVELVQRTRAIDPAEAPLRAGEYTVRVTPRQMFKGETEVTHLYEAEPFLVTIVVLPRPVTITTGSAQQIYNAQPLVCREHTAQELISGDYLVEASEEVSIVNAGSIKNRYTYSIFNKNDEDVTDCYKIDYQYGTLTVNKRPIAANSESKSWKYDGEAHAMTENYSLDGLVSGHKGKVVESASAQITYVGTVPNVLYFEISDEDDNSFTENYKVNGTWGTLEITKRPITITTGSNEKIYDGTELTNKTARPGVDLASGENLKEDSVFGIIDAGEAENKTTYRIYSDNTDTTENYDITYEYGTLKITKRNITVTTATKTAVYDGTPLTCTEEWSAPDLVSSHSLVADSSKPIASVTNVAEGEVENKVSYLVFDPYGNEVTANYELTYEYGKISRTKRPLTVTTADAVKEFDGTAFSYTEDWYAPNLAPNQTLRVDTGKKIASVTEVLENAIDNEVHYYVVDGAGNNVTANYEELEYEWGKLNRTPFELKLHTGTEKWAYDGRSHDYNGYSIVNVETIEAREVLTNAGHSIHYDENYPIPSVTYVSDGVKVNELHFVIVKPNVDHFDDVSYNYKLTVTYGTISIVPYGIIITTGSAEKVYDGDELSNGTAESVVSLLIPSKQGLVNGEHLEVDTLCTITDAVTVHNETTYKIFDGTYETTDNYEITYNPGTLKITPRPLKIIIHSAEKEYDGEALTGANYLVKREFNGLVEGHCPSMLGWSIVASEIVDVGEKENCLEYEILSADSETILTENYDITYVRGTLKITPRKITVTTLSNSWEYDGKEHSYTDYSLTHTDGNGKSALVSGHGLVVTSSTKIRDVATNVENNCTFAVRDGSNLDVTENYKITYVYGTLTVTRREISVTTVTDEWEYDGTAHSNQTATAENIVEGHVVKPVGAPVTITDAGDAINEYTAFEIYNGTEEVTENYKILSVEYGTLKVTPRGIVIETTSESWEYDGEVHSSPKEYLTYHVIEGGIEGIGLLEELGHKLQATSYTEIVDAGEKDNVCEFIVLDSVGNDITKNYSLNYYRGTLTVTPREVLVSTYDATKFYDGKPLYKTEYEAKHVASSGKEPAFVLSHTLELLTNAEITEVGSIDNECTYKVIDAENPDLDITANYSLSYQYGTLTVNKMLILLRTIDYTWEYDGETHSGKAEDIEYGNSIIGGVYNGEGIAEGERIEFTNFATITSVGRTPNKVTYKVYAESDGRETTHNYNFNVTSWGTLTVTARALTITTGSDTKEYDGTKLTCNEPEAVEGLVEGQELVVDTEFSIIDAGEAENATTYQVYSGTNKTTANYTITYVPGTLKITKRVIEITTDSKEFEYNGEAQSYPVAKEIYHVASEGAESALVLGHELSATEYATVTDVKEREVENIVTFIVVDENRESVNGNYEIRYGECGTLKITPRAITVKTGSSSRMYNGEPFTYLEYESVDRLLDTHRLVPDESRKEEFASVTNVYDGIVENEVYYLVLDGNGEDISDNYSITYVWGEIYIDPYELTVTTASAEKVYNGTPLQKLDGFSADWLFGDHKLVLNESRASEFASITNVFDENNVQEDENGRKYGTKANQLYFKVQSSSDARANENYTVAHEELGTLKILAKDVTIKTSTLEKEYDGTPLYGNAEDPQLPYPQYSILEGHTLEADFIDEITDVVWSVGGPLNGVVSDKLNETTYKVLSENGEDYSENYKIHYSNGTLKITPRSITVTTGTSLDTEYDGTTIEYSVAEADNLAENHRLGVGISTTVTDVLPEAIDNVVDCSVYDENLNDVTANYLITYVWGKLNRVPRKIIVTTGSGTHEYDDQPFHYFEGITADRLLTDFGHTLVADENEAYATITDAGTTDNVLSCIVLDADGKNISYNYEITEYINGTLTVEPRDITVTTADHEWTYDGDEHSALGYEADRLVSGHELVAKEYTKIINAGTVDNEIEFEVFKGSKNVTENYNITYVYGTLTVTPREITVTLTPTESAVYGNPIAAYESGAGNYASVSGKGLVAGEELEVAVYYTDESGNSVTPKNAGNYFVVLDKTNSLIHKNGETTDTSNYKITPEESTFEIEKGRIVISLLEVDGKVYNGVGYSYPADNFSYEDGTHTAYDEILTLGTGAYYNTTLSQSSKNAVNAGEYTITFAADSCMIDGSVNASVNYVVTITNPSVAYTITPKEITVSLDNVTREYNGKQFDYLGEKNTVNVKGLVKGTLKATVICEGVYVGTHDVIFDEGNWSVTGDLTSNYTLGSVSNSTVEITKRNITVSAGTHQLEYRGEVIPDEDVPYSSWHAENENEDGFVNGDDKEVSPVYTYTQNGSVAVPKERGLYAVAISFAGNPLIDDNYDITYEEGTLEIIMRFVTVEVNAVEDFEYNGEAFDMSQLSFSHYHTGNREEPGFLDGDEAHYNVAFTVSGYTEGDIIYAGTYTVTVQFTPKEEDDGYVITYKDTTFTVQKRQIYAKAQSYEKEYIYNKQTPDLQAELAEPEYSRPDGSQAFVSNDKAEVSLSYYTTDAKGNTVDAVNVGTYYIYVSSLGSVIEENYELVEDQSKRGELEITPRRLIIAAKKLSTLYLGEPFYLPSNGYNLLGGTSLAGGDTLTVNGDAYLDGKTVFFTMVQITPDYDIKDGALDMRKNYRVIYSYEGNEEELSALGVREDAFYGSLSYERRKIKIRQIPPDAYKDGKFVYNGDFIEIKYEGDGSKLFEVYKTLAESGLAVAENAYGELKDKGHSVTLEFTYTLSSAGIYKKWLHVAVKDKAGNDCSLGYDIVYDDDSKTFITVSQISVSVAVRAADYEEGYTLQESDYVVTNGSLLKGHSLEIKVKDGGFVYTVYELLEGSDTSWKVTSNYKVIITEVAENEND